MVLNMKDTGETTYKMEQVLNPGVMEVSMKEAIRRE
jgi:hypothetical protein